MDEILKLFDCCWSWMEIFKPHPPSSASPTGPSLESDQQLQNEENQTTSLEIKRVPTLLSRSMSEQLSLTDASFFISGSFSPDSVLSESNRLQKIVSGKEMGEYSEEESGNTERVEETETTKMRARNRGRKLGKKQKSSKSLSDLEFEELKGFMDLGFVFSEEDKEDSRLVEIIPGLQKQRKNGDGEEERSSVNETEKPVSRPYLSEAWGVLEGRREEEKPWMKWRVPETSNEMDMKDSLRRWARTVASTVAEDGI